MRSVIRELLYMIVFGLNLVLPILSHGRIIRATEGIMPMAMARAVWKWFEHKK